VTQESILVINTGSSSLKLGLYVNDGSDEKLLFDGLADGIGRDDGTIVLRGDGGSVLRSEALHRGTQEEALKKCVGWLKELSIATPLAIGHRVVHGGPNLTEHQRITPELLRELRAAVHFAPIHVPMALSLIAAAEQAYPQVDQFACFDTAFHRTLPEVAARFPLPRALFDKGIRRYGFHGLSYESIVHRLGDDLPPRTVIAHLGNGASIAAVSNGCSIDTTMGLTPLGGIPMATRSGDLDPGVLLYLMRTGHADAEALEQMLNHDAGLQAISGGVSDMRTLEAKAANGDAEAQLAIRIFCTAIRKVVAGYAAVLGGLDLLVFTGGIGEHSARVRGDVCQDLEFMGVSVDTAKNLKPDGNIAAASSKVRLRVMTSEEDRQIARHCRSMIVESTKLNRPVD
jgi:acetate kinase